MEIDLLLKDIWWFKIYQNSVTDYQIPVIFNYWPNTLSVNSMVKHTLKILHYSKMFKE